MHTPWGTSLAGAETLKHGATGRGHGSRAPQPIPTVSSGARRLLGGTRRDLGLDLARAFAVLSLLIPFGYWLQLIPVLEVLGPRRPSSPAEPLFAPILGAAAWPYAPQTSRSSSPVPSCDSSLLLLGVALMRGCHLPPSRVTPARADFSYSALRHARAWRYSPLLTLFVVHLPLGQSQCWQWSPAFITWTYTLLMDVAAQADAWTAVRLPLPSQTTASATRRARSSSGSCAGHHARAPLRQPAGKARNPRGTRRAGSPSTAPSAPTPSSASSTARRCCYPKPPATLYFWAEYARLLSARRECSPHRPPGPDVAERLHCAERNHYYTGPTVRLHRGRALRATGGWGTAVYWSAFLLLGAVIALGFCTPLVRMALHCGRGPWRRFAPHLRARLTQSELQTKRPPRPRSCAGRGHFYCSTSATEMLRVTKPGPVDRGFIFGMTGFEPATSSSRTTRAPKLHHIPMLTYQ